MGQHIDYYYSHVSPWSYLGAERFCAIAANAGATIAFKPMDLGVIFPQSGGLPLGKRSPQRRTYRMTELKRWKKHLNVEITLEPAHFPTNDKPGALMAIAAGLAGHDMGPLSLAIMGKCWIEEKNIAEEAVLVEAANECGLNGEALLQDSKQDAAAATYEANTNEAAKLQVFGAPAYIYKDELFWGQDRLDFLERALTE